jgi:hypothetical protein
MAVELSHSLLTVEFCFQPGSLLQKVWYLSIIRASASCIDFTVGVLWLQSLLHVAVCLLRTVGQVKALDYESQRAHLCRQLRHLALFPLLPVTFPGVDARLVSCSCESERQSWQSLRQMPILRMTLRCWRLLSWFCMTPSSLWAWHRTLIAPAIPFSVVRK